MNKIFLATVFEPNARGKPWNGPQTIFAFIGPNEGDTNFVAGRIMDALHDDTGGTYSYSVQPLPYLRSGPAGSSDEKTLIQEALKEARR